jgi:hypothetical protein
MSGKGEYFLVRNIQSLLGAEVLFSVQEIFRESAPTLLRFAGPGPGPWEVVRGGGTEKERL